MPSPTSNAIPDPVAPFDSNTNSYPVRVTKIDFERYGLPQYKNRLALVIDNLFSEEDCDRLLSAAVASSETGWSPALLNGGRGKDYLATDERKSGRIMLDDPQLADWILKKLMPHIGDIQTVENARHFPGARGLRATKAKVKSPPTATLTRLNERLRFLRYEPSDYFKPHMDGIYATPDRSEASLMTLQLYLDGDSSSIAGGATRFWSDTQWLSRSSKNGEGQGYVDVPPRRGRALIFEQAGLVHSGEPISKGVKHAMRTDFMYALV